MLDGVGVNSYIPRAFGDSPKAARGLEIVLILTRMKWILREGAGKSCPFLSVSPNTLKSIWRFVLSFLILKRMWLHAYD